MLPVAAASPAGRALRARMDLDSPNSSGASSTASGSSSGSPSSSTNGGGGASRKRPPPAWRLRPAVAHSLPAGFELASQSVALWGLDLPAHMPDTAALPALALLPALADDLAAARAAAEGDAPLDAQSEQGARGSLLARAPLPWMLTDGIALPSAAFTLAAALTIASSIRRPRRALGAQALRARCISSYCSCRCRRRCPHTLHPATHITHRRPRRALGAQALRSRGVRVVPAAAAAGRRNVHPGPLLVLPGGGWPAAEAGESAAAGAAAVC